MEHTNDTTTETTAIRVDVLDPTSHRFLAHVGDTDLPLSADAPDRKPRVRDLDLGRWLQFADERMVRKLIRSMIATGKFSRCEVMYAVEQTSREGGRPATVYWLTREQALLVATQSETPRAWEITRLMVRVFDAVLDRMTPVPPQFDPAMLVELMGRAIGAALRPVVDRLEALEARIVRTESSRELPAHAAIYGAARAQDEITEPMQRWARAMAATEPAPAKAMRRLLGEAHDGLRSRVQFAGYGASWDMLPLVFRPIVQRYVSELFKRVTRKLRALSRAERRRVKSIARKEPTLFDRN